VRNEFREVERLRAVPVIGSAPEPKKRAWRHGRAWKMKILDFGMPGKIRIRASI